MRIIGYRWDELADGCRDCLQEIMAWEAEIVDGF